jgi:acetyl-CoA carboxylase carboxyltransferase component
VPQLAVVDGICSGLTAATLCSMFDFVIANERDARLYIAPPPIMKAKFSVADAGTQRTPRRRQSRQSTCSPPIHLGAVAADMARSLLAYLPSSRS